MVATIEPFAFVERRACARLEMAKLVVVAPDCPMENTVVEAFVTASKRLPVPHRVSLEYGEVVPMPTVPDVARKIEEVASKVFVPL